MYDLKIVLELIYIDTYFFLEKNEPCLRVSNLRNIDTCFTNHRLVYDIQSGSFDHYL